MEWDGTIEGIECLGECVMVTMGSASAMRCIVSVQVQNGYGGGGGICEVIVCCNFVIV